LKEAPFLLGLVNELDGAKAAAVEAMRATEYIFIIIVVPFQLREMPRCKKIP
jgi:hypothetical protein